MMITNLIMGHTCYEHSILPVKSGVVGGAVEGYGMGGG
jgi:hypothetical protein